MLLEPFDFKNMPLLVDRLLDMWAPPVGDVAFKRLYVEAIIRQNIGKGGLQFQFSEGGQFQAVTFFAKKGEENSAASWWNERFNELASEEERTAFFMSREYLECLDKKTFSFMSADDIKLCLFVSVQKGAGKKILDAALERFRKEGYKNLYLWTDSDCNFSWYSERGYCLVDQDIYEPFSIVGEYKTFIFKKKI